MLVLLMYYKHEQTEHEKRCFECLTMRVLYEYVETERLPAYLPPREYQEVSQLTDRLSRRLRDLLPNDDWDTVTKYEDAAAELHTMELEAMFRAAFALAGELR